MRLLFFVLFLAACSSPIVHVNPEDGESIEFWVNDNGTVEKKVEILSTGVLKVDAIESTTGGLPTLGGSTLGALATKDTVSTDEIASDAITLVKMADNSVGSTEIINGAISTIDIASNAITNAKMADNSVGSTEIIDGAISTIDIASDAITNAKMADNSVGSTELTSISVGAWMESNCTLVTATGNRSTDVTASCGSTKFIVSGGCRLTASVSLDDFPMITNNSRSYTNDGWLCNFTCWKWNSGSFGSCTGYQIRTEALCCNKN